MHKTISRRALLTRINRKLKSEGKQLKGIRKDDRDYSKLGPYYVVTTAAKATGKPFASLAQHYPDAARLAHSIEAKRDKATTDEKNRLRSFKSWNTRYSRQDGAIVEANLNLERYAQRLEVIAPFEKVED
jgi:hypothetical protein